MGLAATMSRGPGLLSLRAGQGHGRLPTIGYARATQTPARLRALTIGMAQMGPGPPLPHLLCSARGGRRRYQAGGHRLWEGPSGPEPTPAPLGRAPGPALDGGSCHKDAVDGCACGTAGRNPQVEPAPPGRPPCVAHPPACGPCTVQGRSTREHTDSSPAPTLKARGTGGARGGDFTGRACRPGR